jgi:hypothetical protein
MASLCSLDTLPESPVDFKRHRITSLSATHISLLLVFCDESLLLKLITFEVNGDCEVRDRVGCDLFSDSQKIGGQAHITTSTELSNAYFPQAH